MVLTSHYIIDTDENGVLTETFNSLKALHIFLGGTGDTTFGDVKAIFAEICESTPEAVWSIPLKTLYNHINSVTLVGQDEAKLSPDKKLELSDKMLAFKYLIQRNALKAMN